MGNHKRVAELEAENKQLKIENTTQSEKIATQTLEIERLTILITRYQEHLRLSRHRRFGASSEGSVHPDQITLGIFNEAENLSSEIEERESQEPPRTIPPRTKGKGKRKEFYERLAPPRQEIHDIPKDDQICPDCGGPLHACGQEVLRTEVEIVPATVTAVEHIQIVYSCRSCAKNSDAEMLPMVKAAVPAPVIPGSGVASPSLLSYILCNKFVLSLPFYRQQQELERLGIFLSRQTMANWSVYSSAHWLTQMYSLLQKFLLKEPILHGDETTTQVIKENGRTASQKSYMWVYASGKYSENPIILFEYQPTREGRHPLAFLTGFQGFLHTDAYSGYLKLSEQGVTLVRCWAHVRRKFDEALKALPKKGRTDSPANVGVDYCNRLFKLEGKYDEEGISLDERAKRRELESKPIAEAFFDWAKSTIGQTVSGGKLFLAFQYAINQKETLMNVFLDPRLEFSNNRAERAIRPFAIGRKNWLFCYSSKGARASAVIYSIVETALANGLIPFKYLEFLFRMMPNISVEQYEDCLPWKPLAQNLCAIPIP